MFKGFRAILLFAKSMRRIAVALEEANRIKKEELLTVHGIVIPDPLRRWTREESEVTVTYGQQPTKDEDEEADDWKIPFPRR
jgi:hypothetical protein